MNLPSFRRLAFAFAALAASAAAADSITLASGRVIGRTAITGHRGNSVAAPENTMMAFRRAVAAGFSFECDFYLTNDGEVFCSHDIWMKRCFGLAKFATNVCWKGELENVDAGAFRGPQFAGRPDCRVARIDDVFSIVPADRVVTLEVKDPRPKIVPFIAAAMRRHPNVKEENVIFLAHGAVRAALVKAFPKAVFQHCVNTYSDGWKKGCTPIPVAEQLKRLDARPECRNYSPLFDPDVVTAEYVAAVHSRGCRFFTWCSVDPSAEVALRAFELGVDGICANDPETLWRGMAELRKAR